MAAQEQIETERREEAHRLRALSWVLPPPCTRGCFAYPHKSQYERLGDTHSRSCVPLYPCCALCKQANHVHELGSSLENLSANADGKQTTNVNIHLFNSYLGLKENMGARRKGGVFGTVGTTEAAGTRLGKGLPFPSIHVSIGTLSEWLLLQT